MSEKYNLEIKIPQYEPKSPPKKGLRECVDVSKVKALHKSIEETEGLTEDEKLFLKIAASRHYKFNYGKIANYYASASPQVQKLMEESALVIIDFDNAIANGYVQLNKKIESILSERLKNEE